MTSRHSHRLIVLSCAVAVALLWIASPASAHCDAMDGPVVLDAKTALERGEIAGVLKWIAAEDEPEVRRAFDRALAVRGRGDDARELADLYFFETLVRLHRMSEGASYTGLRPAGEAVSPAVAAADRALQQGEVDDLARRVAGKVEQGIRQRFESALDAKGRSDQSVTAGREFVARYVEFIHYVKDIHDMADGGQGGHGHTSSARSSSAESSHAGPDGGR